MNSTIQVRVNAKTKRKVANIFQSLGMDMSTGVKIYFERVIEEKGIPFRLRLTENGYTSEQEAKILAIAKQTEEDYRSGKRKAHTSVESMIKEIMAS